MEYLNSDKLLAAAPWLRKYGRRLLHALARGGISSLEDILSVNPDEFGARPGVGVRSRVELTQVQEELRQRQFMSPDADETDALIPADADVLTIPSIRARYPPRLLNSLARLDLRQPAAIMQLVPEEFLRVPGIGWGQVRALWDLRAEVGAMLRGESAVPPAAKVPTAPKPAPAVSDPLPPELELPECAEVPISSIWSIWIGVSAYIRSSLERYDLMWVSDILRLPPQRFAQLRGIGRRRVTEFVALQDQLRDWVARQSGGPHEEGEVLGDVEGVTRPTAGASLAAKWSSLDDLIAAAVTQVCAARHGVVNAQRDGDLWLGHLGVGVEETRTLQELGDAHGITRERVRQVVNMVTLQVQQEFGANRSLATLLVKLGEVFTCCLGAAEVRTFASMLQVTMDWEREPSPRGIALLARLLEGSPYAFVVDHAGGLVRHVDMCQSLWQRAAVQADQLLCEMVGRMPFVDFACRLSATMQNGCPASRRRPTGVVPCCGVGGGEVRLPAAYVQALLSTFHPSLLDGETVVGYWWVVLRNGGTESAAI